MSRFSHGFPDKTQAAIVEALRKIGATVEIISKVGKGTPDLLVGFRRRTFLMECKNAERLKKHGSKYERAHGGLRETQVKWMDEWQGAPPLVADSPAGAVEALMREAA
jgi:hypothetical protein